MTPTADARPTSGRLRDLLLEYLSRTGVVTWPGVDGMQIEDVLVTYIPAASAGLVPGREELGASHPELAAELDAFFTCDCTSAPAASQSQIP
jgi:hypothetical protein